jgi:acetylornithine deacetylase
MSGVVETLRELVAISSVSRESNRGVISFAEMLLADAGWRFEEHPYLDPSGAEKINLVAWPAGLPPVELPTLGKQVELALVCHTDTVPYAANWSSAITLIAEGDNLKGCGACDVKGFLACLLAVGGQIEIQRLNKPLAIILTADEEIGCVGVRQLVEQQAIHPKFAIVGEPTSLQPIRAGKGYCLAEILVTGSEAHSAFPEKGESAIYRAARLIVDIEKIGERLKEYRSNDFSPPCTTINVGEIQGGVAKNIVPGSCRFLLEWRPIAGQDPSLVPTLVQDAIAKLSEADETFRCELKVLRTQEGFSTFEESRLVRSLASASGKTPGSVAFGTEAPWLGKMGAEAIVFGPGSMLSAHSPREFVPASELTRCVEILKTAIYDLCG